MRWKRPISAVTATVKSQTAGISTVFNHISVFKLATTLALQFSQLEK